MLASPYVYVHVRRGPDKSDVHSTIASCCLLFDIRDKRREKMAVVAMHLVFFFF
jgi:hypothetical protein